MGVGAVQLSYSPRAGVLVPAMASSNKFKCIMLQRTAGKRREIVALGGEQQHFARRELGAAASIRRDVRLRYLLTDLYFR